MKDSFRVVEGGLLAAEVEEILVRSGWIKLCEPDLSSAEFWQAPNCKILYPSASSAYRALLARHEAAL